MAFLRFGAAGVNALAAIVLAAGAASRMGRAKQILSFEGEPLVARVARAAREAGCDRVIVVVGGYADAVKSSVEQLGVTFVENACWAEGLASSLRAGLAAAADAKAAFLLLADQPHVNAAVLRRLHAAFEAGGYAAAASRYSGVAGPPAVFRRSLFGELAALKGDEGARRILARDPRRVTLVDFPLGAVDLDTPEDAARLLGARPSNLLLRAAMLSLRAECSKNGLCGVALLRLRAVFLRSRSRVGLTALATDITRTAS